MTYKHFNFSPIVGNLVIGGDLVGVTPHEDVFSRFQHLDGRRSPWWVTQWPEPILSTKFFFPDGLSLTLSSLETAPNDKNTELLSVQSVVIM